MKIYKLDIDASKPIRKVVQMQQNSTGALSVDVSNDGKYIRNLSCALYEGDTELSAYAITDIGAGYKIDMSDETKVVKFTAKSTPVECTREYILSVQEGTRTFTKKLNVLQLEAGTYRQDEFMNLVDDLGDNNFYVDVVLSSGPMVEPSSIASFDDIRIAKWNPVQPLWFKLGQNDWLPQDEVLSVYQDCVFYIIAAFKSKSANGATISSYTYPAVGYWTDYSLDTVIRPSENAHCYAEQEVTDPEPEPTPDPEEPVEPTEG